MVDDDTNGFWIAANDPGADCAVHPVVLGAGQDRNTCSGAKPGTVEHIKIHGAALEDNLEGNAVDRDVLVFLPPGYAAHSRRRYPVVYALHGYSIGAEQWSQEIHVPQTIGALSPKGQRR